MSQIKCVTSLVSQNTHVVEKHMFRSHQVEISQARVHRLTFGGLALSHQESPPPVV